VSVNFEADFVLFLGATGVPELRRAFIAILGYTYWPYKSRDKLSFPEIPIS
jgi:hypothetical protein